MSPVFRDKNVPVLLEWGRHRSPEGFMTGFGEGEERGGQSDLPASIFFSKLNLKYSVCQDGTIWGGVS